MVRKLAKMNYSPMGERKIYQYDAESVGTLMYEAYRGTVDYDGETLAQSVDEITSTLNGKYGRVISEASYAVFEGSEAASAVIFVFFEKSNMPLLAFTMTNPKFQGRGYTTALVKRGMNALVDLGYTECCLYVTDGNQPAQSIYEKLGFSYQ